MAAALIVDIGGIEGEPERPALLDWPIPTTDDYRRLAERAGLRIIAIDDLTPSFREIGARWRGALMVWELALAPAFKYDDWTVLRDIVGRLAEWAT
jgi:hypothetical protein